MQNVVSLQPDRPRPHRDFGVPRSGARILFFTGVRYCRDDTRDEGRGDGHDGGEAPVGPADLALHRASASGRMVDAAAH